jgi:hypothetical protein
LLLRLYGRTLTDTLGNSTSGSRNEGNEGSTEEHVYEWSELREKRHQALEVVEVEDEE